jgi:2,4-dichlorophenol 6-monooxygenase
MAHLDCGALLQMGPTWGRHSEEWVLTFGFPVTDDKRFDTDALPARIRQLLKLPDLEMEVQHVNHWVLDKVVADKYRVGRVFITGDAAHRRPPASGLGLNTGIEDAQNIAWKLGSVIHGRADVSLLDTYEAERRPVGIRNSDWAFFSFSNLNVLTAGVGLIPGAQQYNQQRFRDIFEDSERGRAQLHHIRRVLSTQNVEYSAHDIELGFHYDNGVIVADGTSAPAADPEGQIYVPTTRPGHRLPHAWIEQDGKKISTQDLITNSNSDFLLITDEDGDKWAEAAKTISETTNVAVGAAQIRARDLSKPTCLCLDVQDMWIRLKEVAAGGAILVRPDNFVAWRSHNLSDEPEKELRSALKALMMLPLREVAVHDEAALVVVEEAAEVEAKMADALTETVTLPAIKIDELEEDKNVKEGSEAGSLDRSTVASSSVATPNNEVGETHVEETPVNLPIVKETTDGKEGESLGTADVDNMVKSIIHGLQTKGFETVEAEPVDEDNKAVV